MGREPVAVCRSAAYRNDSLQNIPCGTPIESDEAMARRLQQGYSADTQVQMTGLGNSHRPSAAFHDAPSSRPSIPFHDVVSPGTRDQRGASEVGRRC